MRTIRDEDEPRGAVSVENVKCLRDTGKALLCLIEGAEVWIPQSQITDDSEVYAAGDEGTLVITAWIAKQKDLA